VAAGVAAPSLPEWEAVAWAGDHECQEVAQEWGGDVQPECCSWRKRAWATKVNLPNLDGSEFSAAPLSKKWQETFDI